MTDGKEWPLPRRHPCRDHAARRRRCCQEQLHEGLDRRHEGPGCRKTHSAAPMTLFSALAAVEHTQAMKPNMSKLGSKPLATTTPSTTGTREQYTRNDSRFDRIMNAKAAVKNGVVELMACGGGGDLPEGWAMWHKGRQRRGESGLRLVKNVQAAITDDTYWMIRLHFKTPSHSKTHACVSRLAMVCQLTRCSGKECFRLCVAPLTADRWSSRAHGVSRLRADSMSCSSVMLPWCSGEAIPGWP